MKKEQKMVLRRNNNTMKVYCFLTVLRKRLDTEVRVGDILSSLLAIVGIIIIIGSVGGYEVNTIKTMGEFVMKASIGAVLTGLGYCIYKL